MIKHVVMWKLKDFAEGNSKIENAKHMKQKLESLKTKIEEIKSIEVGINVNKSPLAFDIISIIDFADLKDLESYHMHPSHNEISDFISRVRDLRIVCDYEFANTKI